MILTLTLVLALVLTLVAMARAVAPFDTGYFDSYDGDRSYASSYRDMFDEQYVIGLIEAVWGHRPPYRLLDCGSANGLTLGDFARAGVDAWGVENSEYIHAQTPEGARPRNMLGDVTAGLPFPDNFFDFVYDTALCYVEPADLDKAIRELYRITRVGVLLSGITADMLPEALDENDARYGVRSLFPLPEWAARFERNGFRPAVLDPGALARAWRIECDDNEDGPAWYPSPEAFRYCFYSKPPGGGR
jgi:SAM-dependent methyltransferase